MGSHNRFVLGDVLSAKLDGTFDTVALLGNALCHFNTVKFGTILDGVEPGVHVGTSFIVDYRDVVGMLYRGEWKKSYSERRGSRIIVGVGKGIDTVKGDMLIQSETGGRHNLDFTHAVWSPFIIEPLMAAKGWKLVRRRPKPEWKGWLDVYERGPK